MRIINFLAFRHFKASRVVAAEINALRKDNDFVRGKLFYYHAAKIFLINPQVAEIAAADQKNNVIAPNVFIKAKSPKDFAECARQIIVGDFDNRVVGKIIFQSEKLACNNRLVAEIAVSRCAQQKNSLIIGANRICNL